MRGKYQIETTNGRIFTGLESFELNEDGHGRLLNEIISADWVDVGRMTLNCSDGVKRVFNPAQVVSLGIVKEH